MTEQMRFLEEAFITLGAVIVAVLDVVGLLVIHKVHLLKEFLLADVATELRLLQVHLAMGEQTASRLKHLATIGTFFFGRFSRLWLRCS